MIGRKKSKVYIMDQEDASGQKVSRNYYIRHSYNAGAFYFMGFLGSVVYYISTATGFWNGVLGVLKAIFWPAFLVHGLMKFAGM